MRPGIVGFLLAFGTYLIASGRLRRGLQGSTVDSSSTTLPEFGSYLLALMLYGISLEGIYLVSKRGAWIFMVIVTGAIMMSLPNFANEVLWFAGGAKSVTTKATTRRTGKGKSK